MKATVFLGGGRITSALIAGLRLAGVRSRIVVHDRNPYKLRALKKQFGVIAEPDLHQAAALADFLIVAVRPDNVSDVLESIARNTSSPRTRRPQFLACSLAAGIPLAALKKYLPAFWVRAMPSPAARLGLGLTALAFDRSVPKAARTQVKGFFGMVGPVLEIPERKFDAFTVTYSASHGYHALAALAESAQRLGLDRKTAYVAGAHALADGIVSWRKGDESLPSLLREAATPGGIAATVMAAMDAAGYSSIVEKALRAGIERARKNTRR